jgi:4-coumarate--CoA ligase
MQHVVVDPLPHFFHLCPSITVSVSATNSASGYITNTETVTGLVQIMTLPVFLSQKVVLMRKYNLRSMLRAIVANEAEELWLVPRKRSSCEIYRIVADNLLSNSHPARQRSSGKAITLTIRQFNTGAAPLSPEVIQKLAERFPQAGIKQGWGMTESTSCITATPAAMLAYRYAHTVGSIVPNTTIKIVDPESNQEVGYNTPGEVSLD